MNISGERTEWDTPCVGICSTTNIGDDICAGCWRIASEVITWNTLSQDERIAINRRIRFERGIDAMCSFLTQFEVTK